MQKEFFLMHGTIILSLLPIPMKIVALSIYCPNFVIRSLLPLYSRGASKLRIMKVLLVYLVLIKV